MAILRGGKRIGGIDVRIGIPRDRSLDNVNADPRLRRQQGGSPETTMGRFLAMVNEAEGFARQGRYYVEFFLPKGFSTELDFGDTGADFSDVAIERNTSFKSETEMRTYQQENARRVQAFCSKISLPDRTVDFATVKHNGPERHHVTNFSSEDITATFYSDKFLRERTYFELWQNAAFSLDSFNYNYYKNYVSDMRIYQLGQYASRQERDDITYAVQLFDCYPASIGSVDYSHQANGVVSFDVTFKFRHWINFFIDKTGGIELGRANGRIPTVKGVGGLAGLLNKLPPEIRRAGRDVLGALRRRVPLGKVTGGRAFPPFKLPPLNI